MKKRLVVFGWYALFWLSLFVFGRVLFLIYQYTYDISIKEWLLTFVYGLRLDISTAGYILAITGLIFLFTVFSGGKIINRALKLFTIIIFSLCSILIVADLELYKNWGYRMDATPLLYIMKPKEALASTELWLVFVLILLIAGMTFLGIYLYNKFIGVKVLQIQKSNIYSTFFLLLLTGSMILPIRASFSIAPVNTGMVYFSTNTFANHAAVNVVWNVMNSLVYRKNQEKSYDFMNDVVADNIVRELNQQTGKSKKILNGDKPNIVLIILESFSSKVIGELGGKWDATPNLNKLVNEGLIFTNFYATGSRSDKGIVSILSGYPSQPTTSIIKLPGKTQSLPSLFHSFNDAGYETYFYYGGDINFANMHSYFLNSGVKNIVSDKNFDSKLINSKWGVHDEHLLKYLYDDLIKEKESYLKVVFTLSSHDPYDVPMKPVFEGNDYSTKFMNSVFYTDSCLGDFFDKVKMSAIWENTLFILVADHGSSRPGDSPNYDIEKFKIPMLWLGGVLNDSIKTCNKIASQLDIPATLLNQLDVNSDKYIYSKDLFKDGNSDFVFYAFNDGFGFLTDTSKIIYDNIGSTILFSEGLYEQDLIKGKAYLQSLMNDYIKR